MQLGWGMPFDLHFENDPPWMQVGLLSLWTMSIRRSRHDTCHVWGGDEDSTAWVLFLCKEIFLPSPILHKQMHKVPLNLGF